MLIIRIISDFIAIAPGIGIDVLTSMLEWHEWLSGLRRG
jgi:hypothetical protein